MEAPGPSESEVVNGICCIEWSFQQKEKGGRPIESAHTILVVVHKILDSDHVSRFPMRREFPSNSVAGPQLVITRISIDDVLLIKATW